MLVKKLDGLDRERRRTEMTKHDRQDAKRNLNSGGARQQQNLERQLGFYVCEEKNDEFDLHADRGSLNN